GRPSAPPGARRAGSSGGLLTDHLSWRWVFLINVPVGAAVTVVAVRWLRDGRDGGGRARLDLPGAVLVTTGVGLLAFGIGRIESHGWAGLVPLGTGLALLAAFVAVEARAAQPLVRLALFRVRSVAVGNPPHVVSVAGGVAV